MKIIYTCFFILLSTTFLLAQEFVSEVESDWFAEGLSVIETSEGEFFATGIFNPKNSDKDGPYLLKFDQNGDFLWSKEFFSEFNSSYFCEGLVKTPDGNYLFVIFGTDSFDQEANFYPEIIKINSEGDVLLRKKLIPDPGDFDKVYISSGDIKSLDDGNFIFFGRNIHTHRDFTTGTDGENNLTVIKFSQDGELIWDTSVRTEKYSEYYYQLHTFGSEISLITHDGSFNGLDKFVHLTNIDSLGNIVETINLDLFPSDAVVQSFKLSDGNILGFNNHRDSSFYYRLKPVKFSRKGKLIEEWEEFKDADPTGIVNIKERSNGNIIAFGRTAPDTTILMEYNSTGKLLGSKEFRFLNQRDERLYVGYIKDDYLVATGASSVDFDRENYFLFVKKQIGSIAVIEPISGENFLSLKNNPSTDFVTVQSNRPGNFKGGLFDSFGKQVRAIQFSGTEFSVLKNDLPVGVYFLNLKNDEDEQSVLKVMFY